MFNISSCPITYYGVEYKSLHDSVKLIKFADDTTLIGLISNNDESAYRREVDRLVSWCSGNNLELNAQKTVEMIVDFRKSTVPPPPPSVMDSPITSVESFRFLGTTITQDLKWEPTISSLIKKAQQRMYFLRQLRKAKLPAQMLVQFYTAIIESILTSSITVWFAGATVRDKQRLQRIVRSAEEVIGRSLPSLQDLCVPWKEYTCTVTGNTMIDRTGQTRAIANFCPQVLLKNKYLNLTVSYAARRLSDVPLLNHVAFELDDKVIAIKNALIEFDNTSTEIASKMNISELEFSRVPGGILGTIARDDFHAVVFYDGTTLHIHYEGSPEQVVGQHMCANNSELITRAVVGCDQVDSDTRGDSIDCGAATERCKTMFQNAFTNCSVDPKPYITACTNLFCNYTDTDDMMCRVLEAYARHCHAEDWMNSVGCAPSGCIHEKCLDHEFCGLSLGRRSLCLCRAPFAAPYRSNNTFGEDTMCVAKKASVSLVGCLLAEQNINMSSLHLNDPNCTGTINPKTKDVTFTFSDTNHCAANVSIKGNKIIYSNTVMAPEDNGETISRSSPVSIQFSCTYTQPEVHTMSLKIKDRSVVKVIDEGEWTYVFNMTAFSDEGLSSPLTNESNLHLDDMLWIQTKVSEVDEQLISLVIEECWATKENNATAAQKYSLVKNGCSDEDSVKMKTNGESLASVFSFRVFQFVGSENDVYVHCETKLCIKADGCTKTCTGP
uniref:Uncharacterized protein n=1 Tax=Knipowitschia caucasica TaxID=637954 RepID=A0AAV2JWJ7_KNICA